MSTAEALYPIFNFRFRFYVCVQSIYIQSEAIEANEYR
jgi:hypothetical protein